jgi:hypothetical protein
MGALDKGRLSHRAFNRRGLGEPSGLRSKDDPSVESWRFRQFAGKAMIGPYGLSKQATTAKVFGTEHQGPFVL